VGQETVNQGAWKDPPAHRLRAQSVALAQHYREERQGEIGTDDEHAADAPYLRRFLRLGPTLKPGVSHSDRIGIIVGIAELEEARRLVRSGLWWLTYPGLPAHPLHGVQRPSERLKWAER
jgi:hypothetical protein